MRHPVPLMRDDEAALKQRRQHAYDGRKKPRWHMRYLLATQQAHDRLEVARLLGGHRHTLSRWLALYATGGLDAWLATSIPTGKPVALAPAGLARLEQARRRPEGCAS